MDPAIGAVSHTSGLKVNPLAENEQTAPINFSDFIMQDKAI